MDIISYIDTNRDLMIDWVYEFFDKKYSKEQVNYYLYEHDKVSTLRNGVQKLADEFISLENHEQNTIEKWYKETDFYIFDLLPWNGCSMFKDKINIISDTIKKYNIKFIIDFGAGLGVSSIYLSQQLGVEVIYVDLKDSVTSKFAKFMMKKLNITNIQMMTTEELFDSNIHCDMILAMDCFEHIINMEEIFDKLINHSYKIYHDSTFFSNKNQPQHIYTPLPIDFYNMCALRNYIPNRNPNLLNRIYLEFDNKGILHINFL